MKKDWLEDIHDRMADFEVDVPVTRDQREQPQGLWDDICAAEAKAEKTPIIGNRRKIWIGSSAAAAACLLLFWFMRPDLEQVSEVQELPIQEIASTDHRTPIEEQVLPEQSDQAAQPIIAAATSGKIKVAEKTDSLEQSEGLKPSDSTKPTEETNHQESKNHQEGKNRPEEKKHLEPLPEEPLKHYDYLAQTTHKRHNSDPRLSLGLSTSGGIGSDNRQLFQGGYAAGASTMLSESDWLDSPLLGIMALNRGAETERRVTHHAPIRTGLSFAYRLNDRWSIESGITYALVSSDIHEGSAANFIEQEQKLHYVGIPLGATYRLLSWKRLDLYLSSNILAEQCVSGQLRKKFIISDKAQGDEKTTTLHSRPMQWSVGAKAGVQYNLTPLLSIYAEPGCSYYFDDHSSLETVFKDKVFDFNLNLGLRFSVGQ